MAVSRRLRLPTLQRSLELLRLGFIAYVLYAEWFVYHFASWRCGWPKPGLSAAGLPLVAAGDRPARVLVAADMSLPAFYNGARDRLRNVVGDLNVRRSWSTAISFWPDAVVLLGDMLDDGSDIRDEDEYLSYADRFKRTFATPKGVDTLWVAGNRDVGLGTSTSFSARHRKYFSKAFAGQPLNHVARIGNHTLVLLDAPGLVEEDYLRFGKDEPFEDWKPTQGGAIDFVKNFNVRDANEKVVLFSHIPLARPEHASCGPLRERKGGIRKGVGHGYQNLIGKQTTRFVLEHLQPALVVSADDTDYCEFTHYWPDDRPTREVTIKALAINNRIRRPGFHLLSLSTGAGAQDAPCLMPDPRSLYTRGYLPLLFISLILAVISSRRGGNQRSDRERRAIPQPIWSAASTSSFVSMFGGGNDSPPHTPFALGSFRSHSRPSTPKFSSSVLQLMPDTDTMEHGVSEGLGSSLGLTLQPPSSPGAAMSPTTPMSGGPELDAASFLPAPGSRKVPLASSRKPSYSAQAGAAADRIRFGVPVVGRAWHAVSKLSGAPGGQMSSMSTARRERERKRWWRIAWDTVGPAVGLWLVLAIWTAW